MAYEISVLDNFFSESDPFSPFIDSCSNDIYQTLQENLSTTTTLQENSVDVLHGIDNNIAELFSSSPSSSSPPPISHQLENLSLYHITNQSFSNASSDHSDFSATVSAMEVKTEEYQVPFETTINGFCNSFLLQDSVSTNTTTTATTNNNAVKLLQRSFSSNSFEDNKPNFLFQPPPGLHNHHHLDSVLESPPNYWASQQVLESPAQMRRVCSTGDLQKMKTNQTRSLLSSSPLSTEGLFIEEPNFKVGRYSAEERKERIHRYRAKRTQRNFNKTIKYACRKTLADNRPRIRGRFARNDEAVEIPKTAMFNRYDDEDDLWIDGYHEEDDMGRAPFYSSYGSAQPQYQYYTY